MDKRKLSIFNLLVFGCGSLLAQTVVMDTAPDSTSKHIYTGKSVATTTKYVATKGNNKMIVVRKIVSPAKTETEPKPKAIMSAKPTTGAKTIAPKPPKSSKSPAPKESIASTKNTSTKSTKTASPKLTKIETSKTVVATKTTPSVPTGISKTVPTSPKAVAPVIASKTVAPAEVSKVHTVSLSNEMLAAVNAIRKAGTTCGDEKMPPVKPLVWNTKLEKAALIHVNDMQKNNHFSHAGTDGTLPDDRIKATGYDWERVGENIGSGYKDVPSAVKSWKESTNHCKQMMDAGVTEMGAAHKGNFWCQTFSKPL